MHTTHFLATVHTRSHSREPYLESKKHDMPVWHGVGWLIAQSRASAASSTPAALPTAAAAGADVIGDGRVEAERLSAIGEGQQEGHQSEQVGFVGIQALLQQEQIELTWCGVM